MNKLGKTTVFVSLASLLIFSSIALVFFSTVNLASTEETGTQVSGIISTNTTWTKANSPYFFAANVLVNDSVTLTIEPGVTAYLNDYYLKINGTLRARGTITDKIFIIRNSTSMSFSQDSSIQFTSSSASWDETTEIGSIIENAIISSSREGSNTISIDSSSPKINNNTILNNGYQRSIYLSYSSAIISNNTINSNFAGITFSSGFFGNISEKPSILDNIISGCEVGIEVYSGSPIVERNLIVNNNGSKMSGGGGIRLDGFDYTGTSPLIQNNTIMHNSVGINMLTSPTPIFQFNNIQDNYEYNIYLYDGSSSDINATYNWWGTTNIETINHTIRDFKNDFNLGTVTFIPFLTSPNSQAPVLSTFTISASAGVGGSISPSGIVNVSYGSSQVFTIIPNGGYQIASVLMDGEIATEPYIFSNVINDEHTIIATFEPIPPPNFTIKITHVGEGTVSPSDGVHVVTSPVTLSANPATNYLFMCWLENGSLLSTNNPYNYQVTNNFTVTAVFFDPTPKVTVTPTPSPSQSPVPTANPTANPTSSPSTSPTTAPTQNPTITPTTNPTSNPSPTIPEFNSLIIVAIFSVAGLISIFTLRRKHG